MKKRSPAIRKFDTLTCEVFKRRFSLRQSHQQQDFEQCQASVRKKGDRNNFEIIVHFFKRLELCVFFSYEI